MTQHSTDVVVVGAPANSEAGADAGAAYVYRYSGTSWLLDAKLDPRLREIGAEKLYRELEVPLLPVLARMERHGIKIDRPRLAEPRSRHLR